MANKIPLDVIFSSPWFWKGGKTCDFFTAAHNSIKDTSDETSKLFKERIISNANSSTWNVWNGKPNWKSVLGDDHFELVTTYLDDGKSCKTSETVKQRKPKHWRTNSVVELLGIIRNKHEHNSQYTDEAKRKLGWFEDVDGMFQFQPNLYAKYWNDRFPRLTLFLWIHFCEFQDVPTLKEFYSCDLNIQQYDNASFLNLLSCLQDGLQKQLDRGEVHARYSAKCGKVPVSVEFRTISANYITRLLDGSFTLRSRICKNSAAFTWKDNKTSNSGISQNTFAQRYIIPSDECSYCVSCVFANKVTDLGSVSFKNIDECDCGTMCTKIVIFTNMENLHNSEECFQWVKSQFRSASDNSVCLQDVSQPIRAIVEKQAEVFIQGKRVKLSSLLPTSTESKNKCLHSLSNGLLNELLKGETLELFRKLHLPNIPKIYMQRNFRKTVTLKATILQFASMKNIFVITGLHEELFMKLTGCDKTDITVVRKPTVGSGKFTTSIVILQDYEESEFRLAYKSQFEREKKRNVHVIRYLHEQTFEWLETIGSCKIFTNDCKQFAEEIKLQNENEFLESFETFREHEKVVLIADKPGMGKSVILATFATKIAAKYFDRLAVYISVTEFVDRLGNVADLTEKQLVQTLTEIICTTDFERKLIGLWLHKKHQTLKPKIEIMLDGLDEANDLQRKSTMEAVSTLKNFFPSVRVWLTVRNHMLLELGSKFGLYGYKMIPLSVEDQVKLIVQFWIEYAKTNRVTFKNENRKLASFAKECIEKLDLCKDSEITGIPLMCRMIAEVYEEKVLKQDFTFCSNSGLTGLYDTLLERKLEIFLKIKCGLSTAALNHVLIKNTLRDNLDSWHTYFAIRLIFPETKSNEFSILLQTGSCSLKDIQDSLAQFGLIEKLQPLTFIHRTFAEFLVAKFVYKVLRKDLAQFTHKQMSFESFVWDEVFHVTRVKYNKFEMLFASQPHKQFYTYNPTSVFSYPVVNHFLNDLLSSEHKDGRVCSLHSSHKLLWKLANDVLVNVVINKKLIKKLPLLTALRYFKLFNLFCYLLHKDQKFVRGMIVMGLISYQYACLAYLLREGKYFLPDTWHELQSFDENRYGIVHWCFDSMCKKCFLPEEESHVRFLKYLYDVRPDVFEEKDATGRTPLMMLVVEAPCIKYPIVYNLLEFLVYDLRVNVSITYSDNSTVVHFQHEVKSDSIGQYDTDYLNHYKKILETILKDETHRFLLNIKSFSGHTPLLSCIEHFNSHLSLSLVHRKNRTDQIGTYVLDPDYKKFCTEMIDVLTVFKKYGADFNAKFSDGRPLLQFAIDRRFPENLIRALVEFGSSIYGRNNLGENAIHRVYMRKNVNVLMWLVYDLGADPNVCDFKGKSVVSYGILHFIVSEVCKYYYNNYDRITIKRVKIVIKYLVEMYPNILEQTDLLGRTPLIVLVKEGLKIDDVFCYKVFVNLIKFFVDTLKSEVNVTDKQGNTILHFHEADVFDRYKNEPKLYSKVLRKWCSVFSVVFENNLLAKSLHEANFEGKTPLFILLEKFKNHPAVVIEAIKMFHEFGYDLEATDKNGNTLLMLAIRGNHDVEVIRSLTMNFKVKLITVNFEGKSALSIAVLNRNVRVIQLLLEIVPLRYMINIQKMLRGST